MKTSRAPAFLFFKDGPDIEFVHGGAEGTDGWPVKILPGRGEETWSSWDCNPLWTTLLMVSCTPQNTNFERKTKKGNLISRVAFDFVKRLMRQPLILHMWH